MSRSIFFKIHLVLTVLFLCFELQAQKRSARSKVADTLDVFRKVIEVSNVYKQLPLQLEMELNNSTNFVTGEADSAHIQASFYMQPGLSYIRFGEAEQLVNDSMTLVVSDKLQRMVLYSHAQPILQQMQAITGLQGSDSSLLQMAARFTAQYASSAENVTAIILTSRNVLYGTTEPKESVEFQYNAATKEPLKVITVKRSLLPLTNEDDSTLRGQGNLSDKLIAIEGKGRFLVKEQVGTFVYKKIGHNAGIVLPATISDRIVKNDHGEYTPVKAYEGYAVTLN